MTIVIDAKVMKNKKLNVLKDRVKEINNKISRKPRLIIVSAGDDKSSELYMSNKIKTGNRQFFHRGFALERYGNISLLSYLCRTRRTDDNL